MGINEEVFDVLHDNLVAVKHEYSGKNVILCPICLREMNKSEVIGGGIEHIIPQNVVRDDPKEMKRLGTKNQRCGVTVLCRRPRPCKANGRECKEGCNGLKGRFFDRLYTRKLNYIQISSEELTHRHGVAILVMAYLGAFQLFGYEYILRPQLDEIREQFDYPDERKTDWLDHAMVYLPSGGNPIVATSVGQPFIVGRVLTKDAPLEVFFRRFKAMLPGGHWKVKSGTRTIQTVLPKL